MQKGKLLTLLLSCLCVVSLSSTAACSGTGENSSVSNNSSAADSEVSSPDESSVEESSIEENSSTPDESSVEDGSSMPDESSSQDSSVEESSPEDTSSSEDVSEKTPSEGLTYTLSEDGTQYAVTGIGTCTDTKIVIPNTYNNLPVTSIGSHAFYHSNNFTSITIPDSVTSIGEAAFLDRYDLASVVIGSGLTSIGEDAFAYCTNLKRITVSENNETYKSINGNLYSKDGTTLIQYAVAKTTPNFTLPDGVTHIAQEAFRVGYSYSGCKYLKRINVPENNPNYKSIDGVLYSKDGTTLIQYPAGKRDAVFTVPDGVTSIDDFSFIGNHNLSSLEIPNSVTSIGERAFASCYCLTNVAIGNSVTSIGYNAFYNCSLKYNLKDGLQYLGNVNNPCVCLIGAETTDITTATIDIGCKVIYQHAFEYCEQLVNIEIPDGVTDIGNWTFYECSSLTSITIPDSVTSIGYNAFFGCSGLQYNEKEGLKYLGNENNPYLCLIDTKTTDITTATIDNSCKVIAGSAFSWIDSLTSVTISKSVASIGDCAFEDCKNLTNITFNGTVAQWNAIDKTNYWIDNVPATEVVCSDGKVTLS